MEPLNVAEYIGPHFVLSAVAPVVNSLSFEHSEEPLAGCIITTMADRAHATHQAVAAGVSLIVSTGDCLDLNAKSPGLSPVVAKRPSQRL